MSNRPLSKPMMTSRIDTTSAKRNMNRQANNFAAEIVYLKAKEDSTRH